jgi:fibro-slime domain-containing protein
MNHHKTLFLTLSLFALLAINAAAQTRTIYFYPPDDAKWIAGRSYISNGSTATNYSPPALELTAPAENKCGWYKASGSILPNLFLFYLGKKGVDKIGPNGRQAVELDPGVDDNTAIAALDMFDLNDIFSRLGGNTVYFVADELDPSNPSAGWYNTDPTISDPSLNDDSRCNFQLAAFIYDTDPSVHPDFSCGTWELGVNQGNGADTKGPCEEGPQAYSGAGGNLKPLCTGVVTGLVKKDLDPKTRKIEYSGVDPNKCWTDSSWFNKAFRYEKGVTAEYCYNMPFTQVKTGAAAGSFEFDSDKMVNANGLLVGGFFPEILNNAFDPDCPNCSTKRTADRFIPLHASVSKADFDEYQSKDGDFKTGNGTPRRGAIIGGASTEDIYEWGDLRQNATWYLHGTTAIKNTYNNNNTVYSPLAKANEHFCFESHADFIYDPAQVFYFSGDDPIWVYINNKLVIDLGGAHMAAPGHIKLSTMTPALEEGKTYPIDIFFCDQRTVNSNVRISTNMYIVQKSNFYDQGDGTDQYNNVMCASITSGSDCASKMGLEGSSSGVKDLCGKDLATAPGHTVEFYMVPRGGKEEILLSGANPECTVRGSSSFLCYGGISIEDAVYSCGKFKQCRNNAEAAKAVNITGRYIVYARLMRGGVQQGRSIEVDRFETESNIRIVWGNMVDNESESTKKLNNAYGDLTTQEQFIIAGKRTPIYIASGAWDAPGTFAYDTAEEFLRGKSYSLQVVGSGLRVYKSEEGTETKTSGTLPSGGIDTLWVEGDYSMGTREFTINVVAESTDAPSLKLTVYQPTLRFVDNGTSTAAINPSGYTRWVDGNDPPYTGTPLDVYVVAWDPRRDDICKSCNFMISETSSATGPGAAAINSAWPEVIVVGDAYTIVNGRQTIYISGADVVVGDNFAQWKIMGPSKEDTYAEWVKLQFKEAPVPQANKSYVWDRNGDGIADSIRIEYSKSFKGDKNDIQDSLLPVLLEVVWEKGYSVYYHHPDYTPDFLKNKDNVLGLYNKGFFAKNRAYWDKYIKGDSALVIAEANTAFSREILTYGWNGGKGELHSYTPFYEQDKCPNGVCNSNAFTLNESKPGITDRVSPVVVKAEYTMDKTKNCADKKEPGCKETLVVTLSEPVFTKTDSDNLIKNPFSYCFQYSQGSSCLPKELLDADRSNQNWNNLDWQWEVAQEGSENVAARATYKPNNSRNANTMTHYSTYSTGGKGDSIAEMIYYAYKIPNTDQTTRMPKGSDWIKIRPLGSTGTDTLFVDAEGNAANPREIGVLIKGTNYYKKDPVKIATIGKDATPEDPVLGGIFRPDYNNPDWWVSKEGKDYANNDLFKPGNVSEFLPIPKGYTSDSAKKYYPGSIGTIFDVADIINNDVSRILDECAGKCTLKDGSPLNAENVSKGITVNASAYYHTNIGNYTAHRNPVVANCTAKIFQNRNGEGDCFSNHYNFYLAWDLRTNNNRFAGAGAYVAVSKFYWQIEYKDEKGNLKALKKNNDEFIDMFGVRRGK